MRFALTAVVFALLLGGCAETWDGVKKDSSVIWDNTKDAANTIYEDSKSAIHEATE